MSIIGMIILLGIAIFFAALAYACILVAARADEQSARMHRERQHSLNPPKDEEELPPHDCPWG